MPATARAQPGIVLDRVPEKNGKLHMVPELDGNSLPHAVEVGGRKYQSQVASAVLCYSRLLFFQIHPTFQRFDCKVFLTDAMRYMGGAVERVMIDNTHVVVLRGTGNDPRARDGGVRGTLMEGP